MNGQLDDAARIAALDEAATTGDPKCARWRCMPWGFSAARRPQDTRERVQEDEDRFVRYNAAVRARPPRRSRPREKHLREMLSTADLDKVIDLPRTPKSKTRSRRSSSRPWKHFTHPSAMERRTGQVAAPQSSPT